MIAHFFRKHTKTKFEKTPKVQLLDTQRTMQRTRGNVVSISSIVGQKRELLKARN